MKLSILSRYGFILLSILTLGLFNIIYFLFYGVHEFYYKKVAKYYTETERSAIYISTFGQLSLLLLTIITLGLIWVFIFLSYGFYELFMLNHTENSKKITSTALLSIALASIATLGLVWVVFLVRYWYSEYLSNKIRSSFNNNKLSTGLGAISLLLYLFIFIAIASVISYQLVINPEVYADYFNVTLYTQNNTFFTFSTFFLIISVTFFILRFLLLLFTYIIKERMVYKSTLGRCWLFKPKTEISFHENIVIN